MGELVEYLPPVSVAFDGRALALVGRLSRVAISLGRMMASLDPDNQQEIKKAIASLEDVIGMMSAIDKTFEFIEDDAEKIISEIGDGEISAFVSKGSDAYIVFGAILRRSRTLNVCEIAPVDRQETAAPEADESNVVMLKPQIFVKEIEKVVDKRVLRAKKTL